MFPRSANTALSPLVSGELNPSLLIWKLENGDIIRVFELLKPCWVPLVVLAATLEKLLYLLIGFTLTTDDYYL
jgi:hypothetical protein